MRIRAPIYRTCGFAVLYLGAVLAGHLQVQVSDLFAGWLAPGVAAVWLCAQRQATTRWVDAVALFVTTVVGAAALGVPLSAAVGLAVAQLVQVGVFLALLARWRPQLWGAGGDAGLRTPRDLWGLLGTACVAAVAGSVLATAGVWLAGAVDSWSLLAVMVTRNMSSLLIVTALGISLGHRVTEHRRRHGGLADCRRDIRAALRRTPTRRLGEYLAVIVCSTAVYAAVLAPGPPMPLTYLLMAVTVWEAVRLSTGYVAFANLVQATWTIVFTLRDQGPFSSIESLPQRAMVGQGFVLFAAVVGLALALSRDEAASLAHELRAERNTLAGERDQHARRAELMGAVVDGMADGLHVIDARGRLLLHNRAAQALIGVQLSTGAVPDVATWGLSNLDGTPIATQEMTYTRALAGEPLADRDMLVRNPAVPEGRILNVRATALRAHTDEAQAILLFNDVTADRRHRDELATFAGVVAHDLLNPLTTIEGWTEACQDILAGLPDQPDVAQARDAAARVHRTAQRMRLLITDLLAYTTARHSEMSPEEVDLAGLARDIGAARVDTATATNAPVPRFDIDELEPVFADRVLVRQLLDNLISNAVKYTAPGTTPRIAVRSARTDAAVTVTIADNGIGIPPGEHHAIFHRFHRAHAGAAYAGTGLGLAICQRIVERHGGTIHAEDNPTGGSRFVFTLPSVVPSAAAAERVPS
ncbi:ATP-binding protein [Actinoplanes sp. NPDC049668]|uniref:ATP-binding protein n=1 Tax=unclassified Actinoplanes TaxID=2626549 RepID=UPI0033B5936C